MPRAAKGEPVRQAIECPRCGYDVTGTMSLWTESCPLEGRCTECGYEYQWAEVLGSMRRVPAWFFETAQRRLIRSAISTSVRTLAPWWFWRKVPLHAPCSSLRLFVLMAAWLAIAYTMGIVAISLESPYGWGMLTSLFVRHGTGPPAVATQPLGQSAQLFLQVFRDGAHWPLGLGVTNLPRRSEVAIEWLFLATLLTPTSLLAIQRFIGAERVRLTHLVRAGAYSSVAFLVALSSWFLCFGVIVTWGHSAVVSIQPWVGTLLLRAMLLWPVASVLWWWCACRLYLGIRHACWVALAMQLTAVLAAGALMYLVVPTGEQFWADVLRW